MEEFDFDIVHHPRRQHGYVDSLTRAYEGVGDVLKDDDFPDATIMTINVKETLKKYQEIIQYLNCMRLSVRATKVAQTRITHKSRNYSILKD
jgi:hypothetical protein